MKEKIVYTARDRKTILNQDELTGKRMFMKHVYQNDQLQKTETYFRGDLLNLEIYISDINILDEEILFLNILISSVTVVRVKIDGDYRLLHFRKYSKFKLESEEIKIVDNENRSTAQFHIDKEDYYHKKSIYSVEGEELSFEYFSTGQPLLKKTEIIKKINEFSQNHALEISRTFYLSFFPYIISGENYEVERSFYFTDSVFKGDIEIDLQQAFFEQNFIKKVYAKNSLHEIIYFEDRKIVKRKYFLRGKKSVDRQHQNYEVEIYRFNEEKKGFIKWDVESYERNILQKRKIKVYDVTGKKIFSQWFDAVTGKIESSKKYTYHHNSDSSAWEGFEYSKNGKILLNDIKVDDGWEYIHYTIDEIAGKGFFESDYGKYFAEGLPEIPDVQNPVTDYKMIYKNHLGVCIPEKDAKSLFEYAQEIFENKKLKKRVTRTAESWEKRKENIYISRTEVFHNNMKDVSELDSFLNGNIIYYNHQIKNNYHVYDFVVMDYDYYNKIIFTGTAVFDNYSRIVTKVTRDCSTQKIISAFKIHESYITPLFEIYSVKVNYNEIGEIMNYVDKRIDERLYSKHQYENEYFYNISPVNNSYYKNLDSLVPEKPAFPFFDFESQRMKYKGHDNRDSESHLLFSNSKLKVAWSGNFECLYFVDDEPEIEIFSKALSTELGAAYFYNIKKSVSEIETDYFNARGIYAHFIIHLFSDDIKCEILNNHEHENKLSFRLMNDSDYTNRYCFFYDETWISETVIFSEMIKELLAMT
ncbi:hypothetical protein [Chryseobacterium sp. CFBP8996]|uniref:hypothetical protein n=1 Tax=Chryseobacterium sp. CFBP8996 TaxID=3096529 RepID=UPI002A6AF1FE|nr:hypothetical protein [Chryseobacterium sp. CFBP8996]MDY0930979.1 hypothetical protein [Chryseobacterium sp. CFBP8996]